MSTSRDLFDDAPPWQVHGPLDVVVEVSYATSVPAFVAFTPLPARYRGRKVALVIVDDHVPVTGADDEDTSDEG
jgi:hypothetical protein